MGTRKFTETLDLFTVRSAWIVLKNSTMDADGCDGTERLSG